MNIHEEAGGLSLGIPGDSIHNQLFQSNTIREVDEGSGPSIDHSYVDSKVQEVPEDSQQSEQKIGRCKPGRKPKSGLNRTRSVKAVVEDAKLFLGESPKEPEPSESVQPHEISHDNEESVGVSSHTDKGARDNARKWQRPKNSRVTESELDAADSKGRSDSVAAGGHRKRQQTVALGLQTPGEKRYNLRRPKTTTTATATAAQTSSDVLKTKKEPDGGGVEEGALDTESRRSNLVQVTTLKDEILESKVVWFKTSVDVDDNNNAAKSVGSVDLREEVSGTAENGDEDQSGSTIHEDEDDYDDEIEHPGEVSVGKRIWTFFTS
ncbi:hypothetical protein CRYUN_Cryun06bG0180200 [Craigia yunnanensis]